MKIERVNPDGLFALDAFTQVVTAEGAKKLAFIAGQVGFDAQFQLVGAGDLHAQTVQAFRNLRTAVESVGGEVADIVSTTMYIVDLTPEKVEVFGRASRIDVTHAVPGLDRIDLRADITQRTIRGRVHGLQLGRRVTGHHAGDRFGLID